MSLHVDELVIRGVDGVRHADADRIAHAFTHELTRLLTEQPPAAEAASYGVVRGLRPLPATTSPRRLGRELARSVHRELMR
ncbi:hypothetical protein [Streptomyces paludis]|uniref:hypothetical protein n=1 Tax=Streptomyces paludis TaxID=2282738 RepID=UPI001E3F9555|nr:hypothetical protein [Streptomyces paludis]